jgi:hypothetical protein
VRDIWRLGCALTELRADGARLVLDPVVATLPLDLPSLRDR